jgi:6-pyruvoyltetrahydropterin/6-carboxytetrahydropterin synthase
MKIGRIYTFQSAHYLPNVADGHKCKNLHGHNYKVEIVFLGSLDHRGFVKDFAEIDELMAPILKELDHKLINDVIFNPTAEHIAMWIQAKSGAHGVTVWENERCWARG